MRSATVRTTLIGMSSSLTLHDFEVIARWLHPDRSRGLRVSKGGPFFHCFSCGVGGDVVTWTMATQKLTEEEALSSLAARAGLLPPSASEA